MKRMISIILAVMLLSVQVFAQTDDVSDSSFAFELSVIRDMKVMDPYQDGSMRPLGTVSRAEFTVMLMRLLGYGEISGTGAEFDDVGSSYWAYGSILLARSLGIVSGGGNNRFMPDEAATEAQAVKMTLCGLGYEAAAEAKGGWTTGYLSIAAQNKIADGLSGDLSNPLTRERAAKILYNALDIEIMTESVNDRFEKGETLFEARYEANDWEHGKGLVTANYDTAILETAHLERDQVIIDGKRYRIGETDAAELLGMRVEYFAYEDEHGENRLLSVFATSKNHVLEFDSSRVEQMSADAITYYETEDAQRTTKVRLSAPKLVINGQWINGFTDRDLTIDEGTVRLIDNDNDESYDIIFLNRSRSFLVDRVSESNSLVYLKQAELNGRKAVKLDEDDKDIHCDIRKNGSKINLSGIKPKDVITVFASPNLERVRAEISDDAKDGILSEIDSNAPSVGIDGERYDVAASMKSRLAELNIGTSYRFYLDGSGRVAYAEKTSDASESDMAYLMGCQPGKGLNAGLKLKLLIGAKTYEVEDESADEEENKTITESQNSMIKVVDTAERLKIDGKNYSAEEAVSLLEGVRVFRYKTDEAGVLTAIETAEVFADKEERSFNKSIKSFGGTVSQAFQIDDSTDVFLVAGSSTDDDYFVTVQIKDDSDYVVEGFGRRSEDGYAVDALVLYDSTMVSVVGTIDENTEDSIVKKASRRVGKDDMPYTQLVLYTDGELETKEIKETNKTNAVVSQLRAGTVIKYTDDSYGRIDNIEIVAQMDSAAQGSHTNEHGTNEQISAVCTSVETMVLSNIRNAFVDRIGLSVTGGSSNDKIYSAAVKNGPKYYLYNASKKSVESMTADEINSVENSGQDGADTVFLHAVNDEVRIIVVIR